MGLAHSRLSARIRTLARSCGAQEKRVQSSEQSGRAGGLAGQAERPVQIIGQRDAHAVDLLAALVRDVHDNRGVRRDGAGGNNRNR